MKVTALSCAATAALASFAFAPAASAAPIIYAQSVSGDLKSNYPYVAFTLDVGANTFTGNAGIIDFDALTVTIPANMALVSAGIIQSPSGTIVPKLTWQLRTGTTSAGTLIDDVLVSTPGSGSFEHLPVDAGTYLLFQTGGEGMTFDDTANYTWTLNVVAVPKPASLALFGSVALLVRRRAR